MRRRPLQIFSLLYWMAVVGLFALAAWQRFSLPLDPIADPDTWSYLAPALQKLTGSDFVHQGRNFIYPGFLFCLLRLFGDFRAITVAQHLLGLAAGGLLLMTWRRAYAVLKAPRLKPWRHNALGLGAAAIFLLAGDPIRTEMQIRPEGVCAFFLSLNLWFVVQFIVGTFVEKKPFSPRLGVGVVLTALLLASLKPSFIFLVAISLLPVGVSFLRPGFSSQKSWLAGSAAAGALLILLPEYLLSRHDDFARIFLPTTLFVIHADVIRDQMADDLKLGAEIPYSREWLSRVQAELTEEITKSAVPGSEYYPSLGFSPDHLMYREASIASRLDQDLQSDTAALTGFYRFYYWRTWRHRPLAMAKKVVRQMALFYAPLCPAYDPSKVMLLTDKYRLGVASLNSYAYPGVWQKYRPAVEFMSRTDSLAHDAPSIAQPKVLRRALSFLARAYLPLLFVTLVLAVAAFFHLGRPLGWLAALTLFVFSYNAAACFEVAIIHSLEVVRYTLVQIYFTLLAEFLALWLLVESLFQKRERPGISAV